MPDTSSAKTGLPIQVMLEKSIGLAFPFIVAIVVSGIVLLMIGENPLDIFSLMLQEALGSSRRIAATLSAATPLLFTAVATAICFRSGIFNVGVDGAFVIAGLAAATIGYGLSESMGFFIVPVATLGAAVVGMSWLYVPGYLLARLQVDEVVSTLMLNFVAAGLSGFLVNAVFLSEKAGNNTTDTIPKIAELDRLMPPSTLHSGFIIGLICLLVYAVWANRTPIGFEAKLVGLNQRFALATGISVPTTIIIVMVLSGLVSGLGGASHALGQLYKFSDGFSAGYGFTGMAIALLAHNSAIGIFLGAILFGALASAGTTIQLFSDIPLDLVNIIEGTVMIFAVVELGRITILRRRNTT